MDVVSLDDCYSGVRMMHQSGRTIIMEFILDIVVNNEFQKIGKTRHWIDKK